MRSVVEMGLRICIDAREFSGQRQTGIGRYVDCLIRPLLREKDFELIAFTHCPEYLPAAWQGIRVVTLPRAPRLLVDQILMPWFASRIGADVFFSPYYKTPFTGRFRKVITVHDVMFLRLPEFPVWKRFLAAVQLRMASACADRVLVDSAYTAGDLCGLVPRVAGKLTVLYPCLEKTWACAEDAGAQVSARERFSTGNPYFLYVGNFKPHKNVKLLISAFAEMCDKGEVGDYCLILAGGDPVHRPAIEEWCAQYSCTDKIRIFADITDEALHALYRGASWTVTLSEYEGFGYPLAEAMAGGCPVVCHLCTSLAELAQDCAVPVPNLTADSVRAALLNAIRMEEPERRSLIARGRKNASRFLDGSSSRQFAGLVRDLVRKP